MFNKIDKIFDFNKAALNIYNKRQEILASNIANVDTPGYKSVDIDFKKELIKALDQKNIKNAQFELNKTSDKHFNAKKNIAFSFQIKPVINSQIKSDGNTVDMNRERIEFLDNSLKYQSNLVFIKNEIKNIMRVLQG